MPISHHGPALDLVRDHTILSVVTGSRAYGLATDASDVDRRGVYAAPAPLFWRFTKPPTHVDGPLPEQFSWELERFCVLALGANPTALECLWSPIVERVTPVGEELLAVRSAFLSRHAHRTFLRYAEAQFRKLEGDMRNGGVPRWKHVMHMLRLLVSGLHHYLGFARSQWALFEKSRELKPLLYTFRVLLTGVHLMRSGEVEADLTRLCGEGPAYLGELIEAKRVAEHGALPEGAADVSRLRDDVLALTGRLESARRRSGLPEFPEGRRALHDLVVRARLG